MADYTNLTIGTKIGRGEIKECPYCKRIGLAKDVNGLIFVTHSEGIIPDKHDRETHLVLEDECPKPGVPRQSSHSK
jgi:hypothetical protein